MDTTYLFLFPLCVLVLISLIIIEHWYYIKSLIWKNLCPFCGQQYLIGDFCGPCYLKHITEYRKKN